MLLISNDDFAAGESTNRRIQYYGCVDYETLVHCDPLHNKVVGNAYSSSSVLVNSLVNPKPFYVKGKLGEALEMIGQYREAIHFPSISNTTFNDFSVSFWIKSINESDPGGQVLSYTTNRNSAGWFFDTLGTNGINQTLRFVVTENTGKLVPTKEVKIEPSSFHHIVGTFNGSNVRIFKDGDLVGETKLIGNYSGNAKLPLTIGSASYCVSCNRWSGIIDDLRIYGKALTQEEVKNLFYNPLDSNLRGLIGHWTFDENLNDISDNKNNGYQSTLLASMAFTNDGRLFFSEKNTGEIRIMKDSKILPEPFAKIDDYYVNWEQGLLGITIDPKFADNHFVYLYYTSIDDSTKEVFNRVVRFTEQNDKAIEKTVLLDRIFAEPGYHSGGALAFGPDDKLYITVGDATEHIFAQDPSIPIGKILRINRDGSIPSDNPFPDSPVYTIGHRNMFGIAFDNFGNGLVSENGDFYYDEINLIKKGGNYGFPILQPANMPPDYSNSTSGIKPLRTYWDTIAPTQMIYYHGDKYPLLKDKFLLGTYQGDIYALHLDSNSKEIVGEDRIDFENYPFKPVIGIAESPNGDIYFGAYNMWRLNSSGIDLEKQYLFPIEINATSFTSIDGVQYNKSQNKLLLDLHEQKSSDNSNQSVITLAIPKSLMGNINKVLNGENNQPIQFVNVNNTDYNTISVKIPHQNKLQLVYFGFTSGDDILLE